MGTEGLEPIIADLIRQPRAFTVKFLGDPEKLLVAAGSDASCSGGVLRIKTMGNDLYIPLAAVAYISVAATFSVAI